MGSPFYSDADHKIAAVEVSAHSAVGAPSGSPRLQSIDFLRGAAALGVMVAHAVGFLPASASIFGHIRTIVMQGTYGVPLFFVISGFCIHMRWARTRAAGGGTHLDFRAFWRRRIHRLYPPYFVMLCIGMALMFVGYLIGIGGNLYPEPVLQWMGVDFLVHVFMLHGFHPLFDVGGGNPQFWTLAREEYFYLLYFGLLYWRVRRGIAQPVVAVAALGLIFPLLFIPFLHPESEWWRIISTAGTITLWIQWVLGMVAAEAWCGLIRLPRWTRSVIYAPVFAGIGFWAAEHAPPLGRLAWGLCFFVLVNYCVELESTGRWPTRQLLTGWITRVGIFSYSLYIVHPVVLNILKEFLPVPGKGPALHPVAYLPTIIAMILASYVAGRVFFWAIERHFITAPTAREKVEVNGIVAVAP